MFKGVEVGDSYCYKEEKHYLKDINVIFNTKAYANTKNLKA
jgi:hypothetical protein